MPLRLSLMSMASDIGVVVVMEHFEKKTGCMSVRNFHTFT